jgi:hypothetical protein
MYFKCSENMGHYKYLDVKKQFKYFNLSHDICFNADVLFLNFHSNCHCLKAENDRTDTLIGEACPNRYYHTSKSVTVGGFRSRQFTVFTTWE